MDDDRPPFEQQPSSLPPPIKEPNVPDHPTSNAPKSFPSTNPGDVDFIYEAFPWATYASALLSFILLVLSLSFYGYLSAYGGMPASHVLARWVEPHSRASIQLVTMLSSFLAATLKFGLTRAIVHLAQKRLLEFRTIFEVEIWASLKNRGIIWPWTEARWSRWRATPITLVVTVTCGTLASVFVSLLSPLRVQLYGRVTGENELDFSVNLTSCSIWFDNSILMNRNQSCEIWSTYRGFKYQRCDSASQFLDGLEAGKASMLAYIDTVAQQSGQASNYISTLGRLGNTRISGSTAGVVPMGFAGINALAVKTSSGSDVGPSLSNTPSAPKPNYSLNLQGLPTDVACEYLDPSQLPHTWPPTLNTSDGVRWTTITCSTAPEGLYQVVVPNANNALLVYECRRPTGYHWDYYLHSYFSYNEPLNASLSKAYGGIGSMRCEVTPRLRNVRATFHSHIDAFTMVPIEGNSSMSEVPVVDIFQSVAGSARHIFSHAQTLSTGNLVAYLINTWAVPRLDLPGGVRNQGYPEVVASFLKGIFDYQASNLRMLLETSDNRAPEECFHPVGGSVDYFVIGWGPTLATSLGFIPLGLVFALMLSLHLLGRKGKLVMFDPTNPVSLIAAASARGVSFEPDCVGDPQDRIVRNTMVKYGISDPNTGRYGLVKEAELPRDRAFI